MKIEEYIDKLIEEGKINREDLDELIAREQAKNPVPSLQRENASLIIFSLRQEERIEQAEISHAELFMELIIQGVI